MRFIQQEKLNLENEGGLMFVVCGLWLRWGLISGII